MRSFERDHRSHRWVILLLIFAVAFGIWLLFFKPHATGVANVPVEAPKNRPHLAVLLKGMNNPFWSMVEQGARDAGKALEVDLDLQNVENDSACEQQLVAAEAM